MELFALSVFICVFNSMGLMETVERQDSGWQKLNATCEGQKDPNNFAWRLSCRVDV